MILLSSASSLSSFSTVTDRPVLHTVSEASSTALSTSRKIGCFSATESTAPVLVRECSSTPVRVGEIAARTAAGVGETASGVGETAAKVGETDAGVGETAAGVGETAAGVGEIAAGVGETAAGVGENAAGLGESGVSSISV